MRFKLRNTILIIPAVLVLQLAGMNLALFHLIRQDLYEFIAERKIRNAIQKAAAIRAETELTATEADRSERIQETLEQAFPDTDAFYIRRGKGGPKTYRILLHSDLSRGTGGPFKSHRAHPELAEAIEVLSLPGREEDNNFFYEYRGRTYHLARANVRPDSTRVQVVLITDFAAATESVMTKIAFILLGKVFIQALIISSATWLIIRPLSQIVAGIDAGRIPELSGTTLFEIREVAIALERYQRSLQETKTTEKLYEQMVLASPSGTGIAKMGQREAQIVDANYALSAMTGYTKEELLNGGLNLIVPELFHGWHLRAGKKSEHHFRKAGFHQYQQGMKSEVVGKTQPRNLVCKNGSLLPALVNVSSCIVEGATYYAFSCTSVKELVEAKEEAETLANEVESANSTMAHDIRSAVNTACGMASLIKADVEDLQNMELPEKVQPVIQSLVESAEIILGNTADADNILRNRNRLRNLTENVELKEVSVAAIFKLLDGRYTAQGRRILFEIPEGLEDDRVWVDSSWFASSVLGNLINNALTYSPKERVDVRVSYGLESDRSRAVFKVSDRGVGISEENLERIFKMGKGSRLGVKIDGEKPAGTGIGLYSVKSLVEAQGDKISVESEVGVGSTFIISVKRVRE